MGAGHSMGFRTLFLFAALLIGAPTPAQDSPAAPSPQAGEAKRQLFDRVIDNQKKNEAALNLFERLERVESHKNGSDAVPDVKTSLVIPAGTGTDKIPMKPDGQPIDPASYRAELEKLENALVWSIDDGRAQHDAYDRLAKKQKERADLIEATRTAFLFTFVSSEFRGDRKLLKYRMEPNPAYKATSRMTAIFAKVRGFVWIDEIAAELARVEVEVIDDFSVGGFLAKVYKGSHLMQERYEMAPGVWFPSYAQYDFDGRKLFMSFAIHDRTFYSQYKRIGPPKEALQAIRAELGKPGTAQADP
jgi:hypothetical protein